MSFRTVVQDTLLKAYAGFGSFRGRTESELVVWLRRILARTIIDAVRRFSAATRQMMRERSLEGMLSESDQSVGNLLAASGTSPSERAERRELAVLLADALAALTPDHREVILLRSLQGCDWQEVAVKMNRSKDAVRKLWIRALQQLSPNIQTD
jgi:RNA polymerase sigma-70 factor (ECF subfamily)